ncbi:hypothetical protein [Mesorhizobium caraganae]|uniref:hypothetical protein n=1 Tax=Mesorhizobium caraganae TaxID=483206 RepID=UPI003ECEE240
MKTASRLLQIIALSACFTAQAHGAFSMPGVRQAMRTIDNASQSASQTSATVKIAEAMLS